MRLLFILLLIGCQTMTPYNYAVDEEFKPYLDRFVYLANIDAPKEIVIQFKTTWTQPNQIGQCRINLKNGYAPVININPRFWYNASYASKEQLMFHEFGHCLLHIMEHTDDTIMSDTHLSEWFYLDNYSVLLSQLFKRNLINLTFQAEIYEQ